MEKKRRRKRNQPTVLWTWVKESDRQRAWCACVRERKKEREKQTNDRINMTNETLKMQNCVKHEIRSHIEIATVWKKGVTEYGLKIVENTLSHIFRALHRVFCIVYTRCVWSISK